MFASAEVQTNPSDEKCTTGCPIQRTENVIQLRYFDLPGAHHAWDLVEVGLPTVPHPS
jgi:hypothetical protein